MYEYMGLGWFIVGLIVAWYLYKVAPEKTKKLDPPTQRLCNLNPPLSAERLQMLRRVFVTKVLKKVSPLDISKKVCYNNISTMKVIRQSSLLSKVLL